MEYIAGGDLGRADRSRRRPRSRTSLARELLSALRHIHSAGVLHRDIKPQNVLIDDAGHARLTDFGIAQPRRRDLADQDRPRDRHRELHRAGGQAGRAARASARTSTRSASCSPTSRARARARRSGSSIDRLRDPDPEQRPRSAAAALAALERELPAPARRARRPCRTRSRRKRQPPTRAAAPAPFEPSPGPGPTRARRRAGLLGWLALGAVAVALIAALLLSGRRRSRAASARARRPPRTSDGRRLRRRRLRRPRPRRLRRPRRPRRPPTEAAVTARRRRCGAQRRGQGAHRRGRLRERGPGPRAVGRRAARLRRRADLQLRALQPRRRLPRQRPAEGRDQGAQGADEVRRRPARRRCRRTLDEAYAAAGKKPQAVRGRRRLASSRLGMSVSHDRDTDAKGGLPPSDDGRLLERERELADARFADLRHRPARPPAGADRGRRPGSARRTLLAEARRLAESDGIRVLSARGSELEREFPFGVVRQLFEPLLIDPEVLRARPSRGPAATAEAIFDAPAEAATSSGGDDAGFAALHGLYWLTLNLAGDEPLLLAIDDLHWVDRPSLRFVSYLVAAPRGAAGARSRRPCAPTSRASTQTLLAEIANDPLTMRILTGPAERRRRSLALIAQRLGGAARRGVRLRLPRGHRRQPAAAARAAACAGGRAASQPSAANAGVVRDLGPRAASRAVLLRLARLPADAAKVARAVAVLGEGSELWAVADLAGLDERAAAEAAGELVRAEILRPERAARLRPSARPRRRLPRAAAGRARARAPARAAVLLPRGGREPPSRSPRTCCTRRAAASRGSSRRSRPRARGGAQKGAAESDGRPAAASPRRAAGGRSPGSDPARARPGGDAHARHRGGAPSRPGLRGDRRIPQLRAQTGFWLAQTLNFTRQPHEAGEVARRAQAELPAELDDLHHALEAVELMTVIFGGGGREELERLERHRGGDPGEGPGAKMLAAVTAFHWTNTGGTAEQCDAAGLRGAGRRRPGQASTTASSGWSPTSSSSTPRTRDALDVWEAARREAHRGGSLFGILSLNLWRGYTQLRWGQLAGGRGVAAAGQSGDGAVGL